MTKALFLDTDCLSAFLWVKNECILTKLYPHCIVLPMQVYDELHARGIEHLLARVDTLKQNGDLVIQDIEYGTPDHEIYRKMTSLPDKGLPIIGRGEAAAIALAVINNGILASNNMRDIIPYIKKYNIQHVTTGDILVQAFEKGIIDETTGNAIWAKMISKQRKLPSATFSGYMQTKSR